MEPLVSVRKIVKRFTGTVAQLKDVTFDIRPGEVHVLLGENGAGKSTLMKILSGIYEPSEGEIRLGDAKYSTLSPTISKAFGIAVIYQELSVIDYSASRKTSLWAAFGIVAWSNKAAADSSDS